MPDDTRRALLGSAASAYRQWMMCVATAEMCPDPRHKEDVSLWLALRNDTFGAYRDAIPTWTTTNPAVRAEREIETEVLQSFARDLARIAPQCPTLDTRD